MFLSSKSSWFGGEHENMNSNYHIIKCKYYNRGTMGALSEKDAHASFFSKLDSAWLGVVSDLLQTKKRSGGVWKFIIQKLRSWMGLRSCPPPPEAVRVWELKGLSGCLCLVTSCCRGSPSVPSHTKLLEDKLRQIKIWDSLFEQNPTPIRQYQTRCGWGSPTNRSWEERLLWRKGGSSVKKLLICYSLKPNWLLWLFVPSILTS